MVYQGRRRALVQAAEAAAAALPPEKKKDNEETGEEEGKENDPKKEAIQAAGLLTPTKPTIVRRTFEPLPETAQVIRIREKLARKHADAAPLNLLPAPPPSAEKSSTRKVDLLTPPPKGKRKREPDVPTSASPSSSQPTIINTCGRGVDAKRAKVAVEAQMKRLQSRQKAATTTTKTP
ncbi:hypothetical protein H310_14126 [Aphanomyces invadans]|uniref:Uncharacterized protein n=1 Tax=Aphanomyces invadans TaxID=157072 RepID=A0A024TCJ2_9STRA|nr:hypothetical protein H310_14126 [Aphanomyces invadans]ETV91306.1 hypothetical protein H310_14126 [Aphanomyces invadans]RHY30780.1 hypothetical protein DYB32_004024 [Aphanomyces invadans]|eukprot:XP_008880143.1 hypothetical protein H310_14126 [Aphanomyces invadans]